MESGACSEQAEPPTVQAAAPHPTLLRRATLPTFGGGEAGRTFSIPNQHPVWP